MQSDTNVTSETSTLSTWLNKPVDPKCQKSAEPIIPDNIRELFGKPALLPGESQSTYEELLKQVVLCINPKDILEWLWVKDTVDYSFDILRHRRFKASLIGLGRRRAVTTVVTKCVHESKHADNLDRLADGYFLNPEIRKELQKVLAALGITEDCIDAQSMIEASGDIAKIDAIEGSAAARRNTAVREIDRSRQQLLVITRDAPKTIDVKPDGSETKV